MDIQDLKYRLEENKRNIVSGIGLLAGTVLIGSGIMMLTRDHLYDEVVGSQINLAEHLLVSNDANALDLYSIEDDVLVASLALPDDALLASHQNLDQTYVYDKTTAMLSRVALDKDALVYEPVAQYDDAIQEDLMTATEFDVTDDQFAFLTPDAFVVLTEKGQLKRLSHLEEDNITAWKLTESGVFKASGDFLSYLPLGEGDEERVEIGDTTTRLQRMGDYVMAHNNFGASLNKSMLLRLQPDAMKVEELSNMEGLNYVKPITPANEKQLVFLNVERSDEGVALRKQLVVLDAYKGEEKATNEPMVLELTTAGNFQEAHTLASSGFLYNYEADTQTIGITELRNGREYKTLSIKSLNEKAPYFLPLSQD